MSSARLIACDRASGKPGTLNTARKGDCQVERTAFNLITSTYTVIGLSLAALPAYSEKLPSASSSAGSSANSSANSSAPANNSNFAKGKVCGHPFAIKEAYFDGRVLLLKEHIPAHRSVYEDSAFTGVKVTFPVTEPTTGTSFYVITPELAKMNANGQEQPRPELTLYYVEGTDWFTPVKFNAKYAMTVRFFEPVKGVLPGHIDLKIDSNHTEIKGYFYAQKGSIATPL
jgi:hypothetical protein